MELDLIFTMRDIYINSNLDTIKKFSSSRSTEFKDILPSFSQMMKSEIMILTSNILMTSMDTTDFDVCEFIKNTKI